MLESQLADMKTEAGNFKKQAMDAQRLLTRERIGNRLMKAKIDALMAKTPALSR
jgi:hypothetical protein